jgi:glycosidase
MTRHHTVRMLVLTALLCLGAALAQTRVTFSYTPPPDAPEISEITVPGSFNGWDNGALAMARQMDGSWTVSVELEPGRHEYKFFINGAWPQDMCNSETWGDPERDYWIDPEADGCVGDGFDGQNAYRDIALSAAPEVGPGMRHDPGDPAHLSEAAGQLSLRLSANRDQVIAAEVIANGAAVPMHRQLVYRNREVWRAALPLATTSYALRVETNEELLELGPFEVPEARFADVPWVASAIGYQIFPERFWNANPALDLDERAQAALDTDYYNYFSERAWREAWGELVPTFTPGWGGEVMDFHCCHQYFGGDLEGIIARLDHLESLGVTLIYLNPIFLSGSVHGYDAYDFFTIAPNLGDEEVLRRLLEAANARGMRLMWDFVPNHVGVGHWAFQDAVANGEDSPYWAWFRFQVPHEELEVGNGAHYGAWWGVGSLPELETRNPEVMDHLLEATRHWTEFGFDGIRVDVPNEIRNRSEFFSAFRETAKSVNPEVYLVGEIWQRNPTWLQGDQFDSLMNYAIGQGVIAAFASGNLDGAGAADDLAILYAEYPEASAAMQFNVISSHDTARLLTMVGGGALFDTPSRESLARQQLASAMLYALPGMPVTFQGDECAFLGTGDGPREENRYPVQWDDCDAGMLEHYQQLGQLKRELEVLSSPVIRSYYGEGPLLAFYRGEPGAGELLAAFNRAEAPQTLALPEGGWRDAISGQALSGELTLAPLGWAYLLRE